MKRLTLAIALMSSSAVAQAHPHDGKGVHVSCDVGSQYSVSTHRQAFVFTGESEVRDIGIGGGRLFIDGREQTLSPADRQRLQAFEHEARRLAPEIKRIALDAVDIAYTALTEVARGLATDPARTIAQLESSRRQARAQLERQPLAAFNEDAMEAVVKPIIAEFVPQIVGGVVSTALKAVFSGGAESTEFKSRMERMERELDVKVEARAKALEPLAEAACNRLRRMDALDDALTFRLPDGKPLQLLDVGPDKDR